MTTTARTARITWAADIAPEVAPWATFPHCPNSRCRRRLWTATPRRSDDPRGPVLAPVNGRCPHCRTELDGAAQ